MEVCGIVIECEEATKCRTDRLVGGPLASSGMVPPCFRQAGPVVQMGRVRQSCVYCSVYW